DLAGAACSTCDARSICDGFYSDYVELFGEQEARPILLGGPVSDPRHFSKHQLKKIHPEDLRWLKAEGEFAETSDSFPLHRGRRPYMARTRSPAAHNQCRMTEVKRT